VNLRLELVIVACVLSVTASAAHHAIAAIYDGTRQQTVEGIVTEFQFVNPHPIIVLEVKDREGRAQSWRLEMDNRFELAQIGFSRDTVRPGDQVLVAGSPARTQERSLYIRRLDRPSDGFWYEQVGASPRIGSRPR
jgi:hypothetical protein